MGQGYQYVGGIIYELTDDGHVPVKQKSSDIGSSVVPTDAAEQVAAPSVPRVYGAPTPKPEAPIAAKQPAPELTPKDVVRLARKRLVEVKREIARLRKLEVERDQLTRLLDAADGKPRAVVRDLPKRSA